MNLAHVLNKKIFIQVRQWKIAQFVGDVTLLE